MRRVSLILAWSILSAFAVAVPILLPTHASALSVTIPVTFSVTSNVTEGWSSTCPGTNPVTGAPCPITDGSGTPITTSSATGPSGPNSVLDSTNSGGTYTVTPPSVDDGVDFHAQGTVTGTLNYPIPVDYSFKLTTSSTNPEQPSNSLVVDWQYNFEVTDSNGNEFFSTFQGSNCTIAGCPPGAFLTGTTTTTDALLGTSLWTYCPTGVIGPVTCYPLPCTSGLTCTTPSNRPLGSSATWTSDFQLTFGGYIGYHGSQTDTFSVTDPFTINTPAVPSPTPEPGTLALLSLGLGAGAVRISRRRAV